MTIADSSSLIIWEWVENIGWVLVILGCIGEGVSEFTKCPANDEKRHKFGKLSWLVLIAGLGLEYLGSGRVGAIKDLQVAQLKKEAGEATKRAALADERAGEANERATKLESTNVAMALLVEKVRQENVALSSGIIGQSNRINQVTRRRVPEVGFGEALKGLPEIKVYLVNTADAEAGLTAFQLQSGFELAGWKVDRTEMPSTQLQGALGIRIECGRLGFSIASRQDRSEEAAYLFLKQLVLMGEGAILSPTARELPANTIVVIVGMNPPLEFRDAFWRMGKMDVQNWEARQAKIGTNSQISPK
jgi:hypothetical protein